MHYIIQGNLFREDRTEELIQTLERFGLSHELIDLHATTEEIACDREDVFVFGAVKMVRLARALRQPLLTSSDFLDFEVHSKLFGTALLNHDSRVYGIEEDFLWPATELFIRPSRDSKAFTGGVFNKARWQELSSGKPMGVKVQVAIPKKITQEIRLWVVGGRIVTSSVYRRGPLLIHDAMVDDDAIRYAEDILERHVIPLDAVVMDICLTEDGWKIVEFNNIQSAGFYTANMQRLIMALEDLHEGRQMGT